jgi:hypothetical protein
MSRLEDAVEELTQVYDDYFQLSDYLRTDGKRILDDANSDQTTRRNLIRVSFPMVEAYSGVLRKICHVLRRHSKIHLTKKQIRLLDDESLLASADRLKESLKLAFRVHELNEPRPLTTKIG